MTSTWICANANPTTWYMGTILGALGLGGALLSAIIGNPLVYLILALVGIIGYKVASTNMGLCRVSFGIAGSRIDNVIGADDNSNITILELRVDVLHFIKFVIGHVCFAKEHIHVSRHTAGYRVNGEFNFRPIGF